MSILRQTTLSISSINKLNLRLVRVFQYLSKFNLFIRYKVEKTNIVFDVLSRLQAKVDVTFTKKLEIFEFLYNISIDLCYKKAITRALSSLCEQVSCYYIILIEMSNNFKHRLK